MPKCPLCGDTVPDVDVHLARSLLKQEGLLTMERTNEQLIKNWRERALESREEANRIRRTINEATDAEMRCNLRAEMWERCANDLEAKGANAAV